MVISTGAAKSNGFKASFSQLFGLWTMRPRISFVSFIWKALNHIIGEGDSELSQAYDRTVGDTIISECLLNIISLPFALHFLGSRNSDAAGRAPPYYDYDSSSVYHSYGFTTFCGIVTAFVLVWQLLRHYVQRDATHTHEVHNKLNWAFHIALAIVIFGAFLSNWLMWTGRLLSYSSAKQIQWPIFTQIFCMLLGPIIVLVVLLVLVSLGALYLLWTRFLDLCLEGVLEILDQTYQLSARYCSSNGLSLSTFPELKA